MTFSFSKKFQVFLKNSDNKTELFKMLAINITKILGNIVEIMATLFFSQTTWMPTYLHSNLVTTNKQTRAYFCVVLLMLEKVDLNGR